MGYELRRYLAELAPVSWRPLMRLVAFEIADRAPDPQQIEEGDRLADGSIRSRVVLEGHQNKQGDYVKGLTDYLGMEKRQVCDQLKALAEAGGYEMRIQLRDRDNDPMFDKLGRPVFAVPGRSMRFRVPPLSQALPVENAAPDVALMGTRKGTHEAGRVPEKAPSEPARVPKEVPVFPTEDLSLSKTHPNSCASPVTTSVEGDQPAAGDVDNRPAA